MKDAGNHMKRAKLLGNFFHWGEQDRLALPCLVPVPHPYPYTPCLALATTCAPLLPPYETCPCPHTYPALVPYVT